MLASYIEKLYMLIQLLSIYPRILLNITIDNSLIHDYLVDYITAYHYQHLLPISWKMGTVLNRMKDQFYDFCEFFFWVMADCIYNLSKIYRPKEKVVQICRKDTDYSEKYFFVNEFFFVRLLVFEIWSTLYMVDFDVCDLMYHVCKRHYRFLQTWFRR